MSSSFGGTYEALEGEYGRDNVVSAYVHMDESGQPHVHFAFVPVIWDAKKDRYTVKAKDVISKTELKKFHPWLAEIMTKEFGRDIGIETGGLGVRGNLTMEQYKIVQEANRKAERAIVEAQDVESRVLVAVDQLKDIQGSVVVATQKATKAQAKVEDLGSKIEESENALRDRCKALVAAQKQLDKVLKDVGTMVDAMASKADLEDMRPKLGIFGRVTLSKEDYDKLYKTAEAAAVAQRLAAKASAATDKLSVDLARQDRRQREMAEKAQRTRVRLLEQEEELGLLRRLLQLVVDLFRSDPDIYKTYRNYHYHRSGNEGFIGRLDWKLQELLDLAMGTSYAAEDKARYLAQCAERKGQKGNERTKNVPER